MSRVESDQPCDHPRLRHGNVTQIAKHAFLAEHVERLGQSTDGMEVDSTHNEEDPQTISRYNNASNSMCAGWLFSLTERREREMVSDNK